MSLSALLGGTITNNDGGTSQFMGQTPTTDKLPSIIPKAMKKTLLLDDKKSPNKSRQPMVI